MRGLRLTLPVAAVLLVACQGATVRSAGPDDAGRVPETVRIALVGDVMLGRGVAPIVAADSGSVFESVRHLLRGADVAAANLESPLTTRGHVSANPNDLRASPDAVSLLSDAGFDVVNLANNHADDAGPESVADTFDVVERAGLVGIGTGQTRDAALSVATIDLGTLSVGFLAVDLTRAGWAADPGEWGVAGWDPGTVATAVATARAEADLVVVSVHGGIEYLGEPDPRVDAIADDLVEWGADVVWGHGSHVVQPVRSTAHGAVIATGLGNFLFDQSMPDTRRGAILEIIASEEGPLAWRVAETDHSTLRVRLDGPVLPDGDAVLLGGEWWTPAGRLVPVDRPESDVSGFSLGVVVAASRGDVTGDGVDDVVVSYRHPARPHPVRDAFPGHPWTDESGTTAHLAVVGLDGGPPLWAGGALFRPVVEVVACDRSVALALGGPNGNGTIATTGWTWNGFGFDVPPDLPGPGTPGCADVDGDGVLDPVSRRRAAAGG